MIIARLQGGLGNQMFQAAHALALGKARRCSWKLDMWGLQAQGPITPRAYALDVLALDASIATPEDLELFSWFPNPSIWQKIAQKCRRFLRPKHTIRQQGSIVDLSHQILRGDLYLDGWWQDERFFSDYAMDVRKAFRFSRDLNCESRALAEHIHTVVDSVFVHVRRGDYVSNPATQIFHGVCSLTYYLEGLAMIRQQRPDARFFIFSDDPDWCRDQFGHDSSLTFVDSTNSEGSAGDHLQLMTLCRHAIISNSSFSWWGAWLIEGEAKQVVAPSRWYADETANAQSSGTVPVGWKRI